MKQTLASVAASCKKLDERVDSLLATRLRYVARTTELTEKIKTHEEFIERMRVPDMMDLIHSTKLPMPFGPNCKIPSGFWNLEGEPKQWFTRAIARDGQVRRQWCVINAVKLFRCVFEGCCAMKFEHSWRRAYLWDNTAKEFVRFEESEKRQNFLMATSLLSKHFNSMLRYYKHRINLEPKGHACIMRDKGLDVLVPFAAFSFQEYEDHARDFVKPVKMYCTSIFRRLNKNMDVFRTKRPRYYKISKCLKSSDSSLTGLEPSGSSDISEEETGLQKMYRLSTPTTVVI